MDDSTIDTLKECPQCGKHVLKHYVTNEFMAIQCQYCLLIGGVLPKNQFEHGLPDNKDRWKLVYHRWNTRCYEKE